MHSYKPDQFLHACFCFSACAHTTARFLFHVSQGDVSHDQILENFLKICKFYDSTDIYNIINFSDN